MSKINLQPLPSLASHSLFVFSTLPTYMSPSKNTDRIYLREDETTVLQSLLKEWSDKPDKKSRDAFVSGTVVPNIQSLNLKDYGPDIISTSKVAKVQWDRRVTVSL